MVLEARNWRSGCRPGLVQPGEGPLLVTAADCSLGESREQQALLWLFFFLNYIYWVTLGDPYKGTNPRTLSNPSHLPKTPDRSTTTLGGTILTNEFWGRHKHSVRHRHQDQREGGTAGSRVEGWDEVGKVGRDLLGQVLNYWKESGLQPKCNALAGLKQRVTWFELALKTSIWIWLRITYKRASMEGGELVRASLQRLGCKKTLNTYVTQW